MATAYGIGVDLHGPWPIQRHYAWAQLQQTIEKVWRGAKGGHLDRVVAGSGWSQEDLNLLVMDLKDVATD